MSIPEALLTAWSLLGSIAWLLSPIYIYLLCKWVKRIEDREIQMLKEWPRLTIVIAACNEADTMQQALDTLLSQDYPDLEIIIVNDRSTDATGEIIEKAAQRDGRIRTVRIDTLPDGWLGKVHALHQGVQLATGEWVLFTDADIHFSRTVLKKAIAIGVTDNLAHLALIPELSSRSFVASCAIGTALRAIAMSQKPWHVHDTSREEAIGGGAFNLVRRADFEQTEGFEWLRMEVADDIGLAHMMKKAGGKPGVYIASNDVIVEWYSSPWNLVKGLEKNAFAQLAKFSFFRGVILGLAMILLSLSQFVFLLPMAPNWLLFTSISAFVAAGISAYLFGKHVSIPWWVILCSYVVGDFFLGLVTIRSTILGTMRGGAIWRGTVYPSKELRKGIRVKF